MGRVARVIQVGPVVITTSVFTRGSQQVKGGRDDGSKEGGVTRGGDMRRGMQVAPRAEKGQDPSPLAPPEGTGPATDLCVVS